MPAFVFRVSGFGFRDSGFGIRVSVFGFRDSRFGIRVPGFGIQDSGFGSRVQGLRFADKPPVLGVVTAQSVVGFSLPLRCRANMAHTGQSRPDSGLGFQKKVLNGLGFRKKVPNTFEVVSSSLGSDCAKRWT